MKNLIVKKLLKKIIKTVVLEGIVPAAEDYVKETDNPHDDKAVAFIKDFLKALLKKL